MNLFDKLTITTAYLKEQMPVIPNVAIVLGSGLGNLTDAVSVEKKIPYSEIPHFPQSTVEGHEGALIIGTINSVPVLLMAGRFHYYEGYDMQEVTYPIRVFQMLGIQNLILSNAAGGMNPTFKVGDIMFIKDHINLMPQHPLRGPNDNRLGTRFPDMSEPYSKDLLNKALAIASKENIDVKTGVYVGLQGPTFETRAEYKWLHIIGGDAVGMSTVPEVIVGIHANMRIFAASIITDIGIREEENTITHEEVLEAANAAAPLLSKIIAQLILEL